MSESSEPDEKLAELLDEIILASESLDEIDGDEVGDVSDWLDALLSTICELDIAGSLPNVRSFYDLCRRSKRVQGLQPLFQLKGSVRRLERYADSFEYGTCTWSSKKIARAEEARQYVQSVVEEVANALRP